MGYCGNTVHGGAPQLPSWCEALSGVKHIISKLSHYPLLVACAVIFAALLAGERRGTGDPGLMLRTAAERNDVTAMAAALAAGASIDAKMGMLHWTPLHAAVQANAGEAARWLLGNGAGVDLLDRAGVRPLHLAVINNAPGMAQLLIRHGADIDRRDEKNLAPLHAAVRRGNLAAAQHLLSKGASVHSVQSGLGWMPLHVAAHAGALEMARLLLDRGAAIDARDAHGRTPLHLAMDANNPAMMKLFLDHGASPEIKDIFGRTVR